MWALLCLCRCVTEHLLLDSRRKEAEEAPAAVHVASLCLARQSAELRGPVGGAGVVAAGNTTVGSEASVDSSLQGQLTQMPASLTSCCVCAVCVYLMCVFVRGACVCMCVCVCIQHVCMYVCMYMRMYILAAYAFRPSVLIIYNMQVAADRQAGMRRVIPPPPAPAAAKDGRAEELHT